MNKSVRTLLVLIVRDEVSVMVLCELAACNINLPLA